MKGRPKAAPMVFHVSPGGVKHMEVLNNSFAPTTDYFVDV